MARDPSLYAQVGRRRRARRAALASLAVLPVLVLAWSLWGGSWPWAGGPATGPEGAAAAFARAWSAGDLAGAPTVAPAEEVRALVGSVTEGLTLEAPAVQVTDTTEVEGDDGLAVATFRVTWDLEGHDGWSYTSSADLRRDEDGVWRVVVEPSTLHPDLHEGESLRLQRLGARRGDILGGDGQPIVTNRPVIDIGVEPSRTTDPPGLTRELEELLDVDADTLLDRIEAAEPDAFVSVITLREPDYAEVEDQVRPLPGTVFHARSAPLAPTREFARAVLGAAGPVTAELLEEHPERYRTGDVVGLSGLQRRFDERLFGQPGLEIVVIPGEEVVGSHAERPLHRIDPQPGEPVRTTLNEDVQLAADAALAEVEYPSALVAIRVSDGHLLAVANGPGADGVPIALHGQYPPGSTFKVVTAAALLEQGLTSDTEVDCPRRATVDGRAFSNAEDGVLGRVPFRSAFAESCNTAFVELAGQLDDDDLHHASLAFGLGADHDLGLGAYTGQVPENDGPVDRAASTIGQGRILTSPLAVADVAATVARGNHLAPTLLLDPVADTGEGAPATLEPTIAASLQQLMREVVTDGSGTALVDVPGGPVHGKTGTAEYGTEQPPRTHAWFAGYQDELAFAVLVAETEDSFGGRVAAPIAADFLRRLHG